MALESYQSFNQQGDVSLLQTSDDGDICVQDGLTVMTGGLEVSAYLSLWGGNEDDDGSEATKSLQYWANLIETEPAKKYTSETQNLLRSLPLTTANLALIEGAAARDLQWMLEDETRVASSVDVEASIPALNRVNIEVRIEADGVESSFKFTANWRAAV